MKTRTLIVSAGFATLAFAHASVQVASDAPAKEAYIFSYFCGQSDGLHLAVSDDGLNWTALNGNKSVLKPTVGRDRLMRDPSICRGPDGVYRMVWTTSWHDRIIGYAETRDFVNWSEQRAIPVMEHEKGCRNCWAPELTYDPDTGTYYIYWASTISGRGDGHRIYRTTTRDFKTFTPTERWFDPGFSVIDAAIVRDPLTHDWVMTIKDEREKPVAKKHILTSRTKSLDKGFPTQLEGPINFGPDWVEGPSPFIVGKDIFVCFDNYRRGCYNMISSSDGGKTWKDRTAELRLPKGIRHGTVITVPKQEKDALAGRFREAVLDTPRRGPHGLTVERLKNPCGVDVPSPRFGWKIAAGKGEKGCVQGAYRILVASSKEKLAADSGDVWDSGKVSGADTIDVAYGGKPLASSRRYWWKVRTWDGAGAESAWSAPAEWTTGIMPGDSWKAKWIGPAPETRPDADLGGARWITEKPNAKGDVVITLDFDFAGAKPGEYVELLHAASTRHEIDVNGHEFHRHSGQVDRWNHLRFRDMTPWLKVGKNTMTVRVKKGAKGVPQAFICAIRFPDGRRIVTNGTRGKDLGALRDTPYGKALVTREEIASPAFEKKFTVAKAVASAFLHVTGVGFYEASLNGRKIGDKVLDPSPTAYDKHVLYSTYDLGGALKPGENTLKVLVGHGWYDVRSIAVWNFDVAPWRDFPRMIAQLEIAYADGSRETVVSDGSWRQVESPVGYDCIREGEVIGAHNPAQPDFAKREIRAAEVSAPKGALVAENCPGAKVMRTIAPKAIHAFPNGTYVVEFPENFAGWIRMDVRGQKQGDVLVIRYDERANKDFSPARSSAPDGIHTFKGSLRGPDAGSATRRIDCHFRYTASQGVCATGAEFQTDRFVSSGAEVERYEPRFTYNGFQYVVLKGLRTAPRKEDVTGCVVHTDFPTIGSFSCSDETFNMLMKMGDRAYRSNFADGYPTDCPHREKNGWTGDASIASELAQYCYENTAGYEKWLNDIMDSQLANGDICGIVPTSGWGYKWGNGPAWDSAMPVVAWNLWCYRGDRRALDAVYPALKRYVDFTTTKARGNLVRHGIGDWNHVNRRHVPSTELTSSCYYRQAAAILSRIAAIKGLADDAARYAKLADAIKDAINAKFYKGNGVYDNGRQTAQAFPLAFGVVPESERAAVAAKLVESVEKEGCHVDIGLLGSKHVFRALSRIGRTDLAFKMLTNPTKPSPVEWIQKGGTTLWEDWGDGASRNHIMFGDFMAWAYQYLGGIQLPEKEGSCAAIPEVSATAFKEVVIAPQFIDALTWAKASVNGPNGTIATSWRRDGEKITLDVAVPPNTTAIVRLPGQPDRRVGQGVYSFVAVEEKPLRVAVFVGKGARNIGVFRWLEITARMKNAVATPVDGAAVRAGALDEADVFVMPGGASVTESKSLGPEGRERVKDFIRRGGGYVGTCAGCCLLMESASHHPDMLHLIPFKFGPSGGKADMSIAFNERATALAGIKKGKASVRFSEGPVLLPSEPVEGANVEVVATYDSDLNSMSGKERPSRAGYAAAVAGTYGKGRLFVFAVHPEYDTDDHYLLQGAFRYVTGRKEFKWDYPQRRRGQLVVGFLCDDSFGVETARLIQRLVTNGEFDVVPLNKKEVDSGGLRNVDAVLAPDGAGAAMLKASLGRGNAGRAKEFIARGGRVFAWGCAAEVAGKLDLGVTCVADAEAALAALRAFASEPVPKDATKRVPPAKVAKPIRAGIYQDPNNSNIIVARMLAFAPEYELKFLSPEDYVNGGLDTIDLIVQPGGGCTSQYKALGEKGAEALKRFVLNGGKYYGICAGAFMALQQSLPNRPRIGLAPFKGDDPAHYRGSAPIKVTFTEEGQKALEGIGKTRTVVYAGGPALIPGEPVEDSDIKILGSYAGRKISTTSGKPVEDMLGKGAFAGGRAGKGKVFISCPHPEFEEANHDIVRSGIKYLTGVAPSPAYLNRTRGAVSVRYRSSDKTSAEFLFGTLLRDRRFYVWTGKDGGALAHLDAVVLTDKTDADEARRMNAFIARGGRVVAVCDTPEKRKAAGLLKGAAIVESYNGVIESILKQ